MDILKTPPEERQYFKDLLAKGAVIFAYLKNRPVKKRTMSIC